MALFSPFGGGGGVSMSQVDAAIAAALAAYVPDPGYLEYVALLTQSGTAAPSATILANTLGGTPAWTRIGVGSYRITLTGAFPTGRTTILMHGPAIYSHDNTGNNSVDVLALDPATLAYIDDGMYGGTTISIRVYPAE